MKIDIRAIVDRARRRVQQSPADPVLAGIVRDLAELVMAGSGAVESEGPCASSDTQSAVPTATVPPSPRWHETLALKQWLAERQQFAAAAEVRKYEIDVLGLRGNGPWTIRVTAEEMERERAAGRLNYTDGIDGKVIRNVGFTATVEVPAIDWVPDTPVLVRRKAAT